MGRPTGEAVLATVCCGGGDGDDDIHLDGPPDAERCAYRADRRAVTIAGRDFPHAGYARHRLTREWDQARFARATVVPLLNHLRDEGWLCTAAPAALFDKWRAGEPITEADVASAVGN